MEFSKYTTPDREDKGLLCYYCSMETFYAIVTSKEFWMNDMNSMNDPMENYMLSINYSEDLKRLYRENPFEFNYSYRGKQLTFNDYIGEINTSYEKFQNFKNNSFYFSLCFSKKIDDLNMWRMYGDNGNGVYIAIKKSSLIKYCTTQNSEKQRYFTENVKYKYDLKELREIFSTRLFNKIKVLSQNSSYETLRKFISSDYIKWLKTECFKYKLGDFAGEKEIRLVYRKDTSDLESSEITQKNIDEMKDINIRYTDNKLIMYKNIPLNSLEIDSICIGPRNNCDKATLKLFLAKNNIFCSKVYKSGSMYR